MSKKVFLVVALVIAIALSACQPKPVVEPVVDEVVEEVVDVVVEEVVEEGVGTEEVVEEDLTYWEEMRADQFAQLVNFEMPTENYKIGVVLNTLVNPYWVAFADGYKQAAEDLNVTVELQVPQTEGDIAGQLAVCETMVTAGYDAIVLHPITGTNLIECIIKANQEGVLMIDTDGRIDKAMVDELGGEYFRVPIEYFFDQGYLGASAIVEKLGSEGGKVAIIEGIAGAPNSEGRTAGAKAAFEEGENIELVASHNADFDRSKALSIAQDILTAHPDLRGVYCANDVMCLAVAEAVDEAGLRGQVLIVGNDFIADALTAIREGRMYGSVAFSPFVRGEVSLKLAVMALQGKELPAEMEFLTIVVTPDIADLMDDWK